MELPGFTKEDVKADLKDGTLTIEASHSENKDEKDQEGKYLRKERYSGSMSRSFYVGEQITQEEIKAKFADGILTILIPKKEKQQEVEQKKYIAIEG
jgi:HSP20 family molecular chaperone IbpA